MIMPCLPDFPEGDVQAIQEALGGILQDGVFVLGTHTTRFERDFADYVGTQHAIAFNSGTSALQALLIAKGVRDKKVAVPTNTNFATVAAIIMEGGIPILIDMNHEHFAPDLALVQKVYAQHPDLVGMVWVHIGGIVSPDAPRVATFCRQHGVFFVEDAAHAHGSVLAGKKAGSLGDGAAFSFFATKVMTTMEGGMVTTNSEEEYAFMRALRNQGKRGGDYGALHSEMGSSWRMTEIAAYMGSRQLARLDEMIAKRARAAARITAFLQEAGIDYCRTAHMDQASHYKLIVKFKNDCSSAELAGMFKARGIILGGGVYEVPCHRQPVFQRLGLGNGEFSVAERYCPRHICLPITSRTTEEEVTRVVDALAQLVH